MNEFAKCDGYVIQENAPARACPIRVQCNRYKATPEKGDRYLRPRMSKINTCLDFVPNENPRSNPYESETY